MEELYAVHEGLTLDRRQRVVEASPKSAFAVVTSIGGEAGWLYANPLWRLRGLMDAALGGPGLRRGRRDQAELREGEALDFWRVEAVEADRILRLRAEMKLPGRAWLEFRLDPEDPAPDGAPRTRITQTAYFEPKGLLGLSYWRALAPVHPAIFRGMIREIGVRAERHELAVARIKEQWAAQVSAPPGSP